MILSSKSLNVDLKYFDENIFIGITVLISTYTSFNHIIGRPSQLHTEPWRRFTIAATSTLIILTIPEGIIGKYQSPWNSQIWISRLTVPVITNIQRRRCPLCKNRFVSITCNLSFWLQMSEPTTQLLLIHKTCHSGCR